METYCLERFLFIDYGGIQCINTCRKWLYLFCYYFKSMWVITSLYIDMLDYYNILINVFASIQRSYFYLRKTI